MENEYIDENEIILEALNEELAFLDSFVAIPFSSQNGEGVEQLKAEIEKSLIQEEA